MNTRSLNSIVSRPAQLCLIIVGIFVFVSYFDFFYLLSDEKLNSSNDHVVKCQWKLGDPVILNLKTKLGVNYDGSHWFHMSENLMTQHSLLRNEFVLDKNSNPIHSERYNHISHAKEVYLNFDKPEFLDDINGMTRLMVSLGLLGTTTITASGTSPAVESLHTESVYFIYTGNTEVPSSLDISLSSLTYMKCHKISLTGNTSLEHRFTQLLPCSSKATSITGGRFVRRLQQLNGIHTVDHRCLRYVQPNQVGGNWPTPQRGHWFEDVRSEQMENKVNEITLQSNNLMSYYQKFDILCPYNASWSRTQFTSLSHHKLPLEEILHITIYQRDLNRKILNLDETLRMLRTYTIPLMQSMVPKNKKYTFEIQVIMHNNERSPCVLRNLLSRTILLLTPHGFQSLLVLLLPNTHHIGFKPMLFEVFPYKYYKRAYGPLSKEMGLHHSSAMSPPITEDRRFLLQFITTMKCMIISQYCREYARGDNVLFTNRGLNILLYEIKDKLLPQLNPVS